MGTGHKVAGKAGIDTNRETGNAVGRLETDGKFPHSEISNHYEQNEFL
jgi:hypothetical protein